MERVGRKSQWLAAIIAFVALTACGGRTPESASNYVDLSEGSSNVEGLTTITATGVDSSAPVEAAITAQPAPVPAPPSIAQETFDQVQAFYDRYLEERADSIDHSADIDNVAPFTTAAGQAEVAEARAYNDGLWDEQKLSAVAELYLYSNIESIVQEDEDTVVVYDCTERHIINAIDHHVVTWETNETRIHVADGKMLVDSFITTHNGFFEPSNPIGCAPVAFRERSEATSAAAWAALQTWVQSPDRSDDDLTDLIGEPLRERILSGSDAGDIAGLVLNEDVETAEFAAVGIDTPTRMLSHGTEDIVVEVRSCHRFPNGRSGVDTLTETQVQALPPGAEQALHFYVLIDPGPRDSRTDRVLGIEFVNSRCSS